MLTAINWSLRWEPFCVLSPKGGPIWQGSMTEIPFTVHRSPFTVHRSPFTVHRSPFTLQVLRKRPPSPPSAVLPPTLAALAWRETSNRLLLLERSEFGGGGSAERPRRRGQIGWRLAVSVPSTQFPAETAPPISVTRLEIMSNT